MFRNDSDVDNEYERCTLKMMKAEYFAMNGFIPKISTNRCETT